MKQLVEQERQAYNEERARFEEDCHNISRSSEARVKIIKSKLITLYDGNLDLAKDLSIDEIIDHVAFRLAQL